MRLCPGPFGALLPNLIFGYHQDLKRAAINHLRNTRGGREFIATIKPILITPVSEIIGPSGICNPLMLSCSHSFDCSVLPTPPVMTAPPFLSQSSGAMYLPPITTDSQQSGQSNFKPDSKINKTSLEAVLLLPLRLHLHDGVHIQDCRVPLFTLDKTPIECNFYPRG